MYNGDFDFYEKEYNRHVAYSLAVVKAEDLFYDFVRRAGQYILSREEQHLEEIKANMRELTNISELYHGHRLFVLHSIVRIYYLCLFTSRTENLRALELEIDNNLQQIKGHFEKYELDTFYQSIRFLTDFLYFEYYQKTGNNVRADHYYRQVNSSVPEIAFKPVFSFYVTSFLQSKVERYLETRNISDLTDLNAELENNFEVDPNEPYPYICFRRFQAITKFYEGDYNGSARIINNMRNEFSLKKFLFTDIECKLFQSLQYCLIGEDSLCNQLLQSVKRQINENEVAYEPASLFIKMIRTAVKPEEFRKKVKKITEIYEAFKAANTGTNRMLGYIHLDESLIRKMANPIKES